MKSGAIFSIAIRISAVLIGQVGPPASVHSVRTVAVTATPTPSGTPTPTPTPTAAVDIAARRAPLLTALAAIVGLPLVLRQLRHRRTANFVAAWKVIADGLQEKEDVPIGRQICRFLNRGNKGHDPQGEFPDPWTWKAMLAKLETPGTEDGQHYPELLEIVKTRPEVREDPGPFIKKAYNAFDLAAILAWHSRIPGLWYAVASEWEDGIINTWETGAPVLKQRHARQRTELYECFSALYATARRFQEVGRGLYPYRGPVQTRRTWMPRWWIAVKARRYRNRVLRPEVRKGATESR